MAEIITRVGIEENGKVIIPPGKFEEINPIVFNNGTVSDKLFKVKDEDGDNLLLVTEEESEGYLLYGTIYRLGPINDNCIVVSEHDERFGEKWAIIETETLDEITKYVYDSISLINEDMYMTKKDGLYGVIDKNGNVILPNKFTEISFESAHNTFSVKLYTSEE